MNLSKLSLAMAALCVPPGHVQKPAPRVVATTPPPAKVLTKYDLERIEKARLKRERKAQKKEEEAYQRFIDECAQYCRCDRGVCDGVLAGGICDALTFDGRCG